MNDNEAITALFFSLFSHAMTTKTMKVTPVNKGEIKHYVREFFLHFLGQAKQVAVGDGGLSGTSGANHQEGDIMCQVQLQEVLLPGRFSCRDGQVTHLSGQVQWSGNMKYKVESLIRNHTVTRVERAMDLEKNNN